MAGTSTVGSDCGCVVFCLRLHDQLWLQVVVFFFFLSFKEDLHEAELLCSFVLNILGDLFKGRNLVIGIIN